jgi:polar amino acid transport system substrate-binding protein
VADPLGVPLELVGLDAAAQEAALRGATVCVGEGSGYAGAVSQRYGAEPRSYPSSVHAASAFMAGECAALAEDGEVLERLMQNEEWRFYKPLESDLRPPSDAAIRHPPAAGR